jgi:hypothetical protein
MEETNDREIEGKEEEAEEEEEEGEPHRSSSVSVITCGSVRPPCSPPSTINAVHNSCVRCSLNTNPCFREILSLACTEPVLINHRCFDSPPKTIELQTKRKGGGGVRRFFFFLLTLDSWPRSLNTSACRTSSWYVRFAKFILGRSIVS